MVKGYDDVVNGKAEELEGLSCPDDYTLKVELDEPYADFPFVVSCAPLSPSIWRGPLPTGDLE